MFYSTIRFNCRTIDGSLVHDSGTVSDTSAFDASLLSDDMISDSVTEIDPEAPVCGLDHFFLVSIYWITLSRTDPFLDSQFTIHVDHL